MYCFPLPLITFLDTERYGVISMCVLRVGGRTTEKCFWKLEGPLNSGRIIKFPSIILPRRKVLGNEGSRQRKRLVSVLSKIVASFKKKRGPARAQTDVLCNFRLRRRTQWLQLLLRFKRSKLFRYFFSLVNNFLWT